MGLTRDLGITVQALEARAIVTCSTANQTLATTGNVVQSTTAAGGINGRVLDRLDTQYGGGILTKATVGAYLWASRGSTEADRKLTLGVKLQHGDSSGGGDAVARVCTAFAPKWPPGRGRYGRPMAGRRRNRFL